MADVRTVRVVVADDSASIRAALIRYLKTLPHVSAVGEAADGEEALRCVEELAPDLLLLDLHMPRRNGFEVLQELQARQAPVTVLVLSAHTPEQYDPLVRELGGAAFIPKGDVDALVATISMAVMALR